MPDYKIRDPQTGRVVMLRGDSPPTEAELEEVFEALSGEAPATAPSMATDLAPAAVVAAEGVRHGAVRAGEEIATHPAIGRAVGAASRPAVGAVARAVGVTGGLPGYIAGEALTHPGVLKAAEAGIRGGGGFLARLAASPLARAVTGLPGALASMAVDAGDRPVGETAATTAARQADFARQYRDMVNRKHGHEVIKGSTTQELIESIARYRGMR